MPERVRKERKPRKPILSPTKIVTFLTCPLLYKFVYVDRVARYLYQPKAYHSFGSSLHRVLSDFHSAGGAEAETAEELVGRLRDRWVPLGYNSASEEREHLQVAADLLPEYHSAQAGTPGAGAVSEREIRTLLIERQLKSDLGDFVLAGRVDRLVELADGTVCVIDYKSGRSTVSEEDIRQDTAMGIYQLLASLNYPQKPVAGRIYCLRTGAQATVRLSETELTEVEERVRALASQMLQIDGDTIIDPVRKADCDGCDFYSRCKHIARLRDEAWD